MERLQEIQMISNAVPSGIFEGEKSWWSCRRAGDLGIDDFSQIGTNWPNLSKCINKGGANSNIYDVPIAFKDLNDGVKRIQIRSTDAVNNLEQVPYAIDVSIIF